ncbi:hypothetical protein V6N12_066483 [Hibiscus sabdariffa]|uniref:Uncharacterized protein n=1 Tax=Hibiscus sabdariffa TaxID=183260 RepID=A0ABR2CQ97_9ROSI
MKVYLKAKKWRPRRRLHEQVNWVVMAMELGNSKKVGILVKEIRESWSEANDVVSKGKKCMLDRAEGITGPMQS